MCNLEEWETKLVTFVVFPFSLELSCNNSQRYKFFSQTYDLVIIYYWGAENLNRIYIFATKIDREIINCYTILRQKTKCIQIYNFYRAKA